MNRQFDVFYVRAFPVARITDRGESGWHSQPGHTRNRYRFEEAILEHIDNTFCEPIQILIRSEKEVIAGPSGVVRLHALATLRGWSEIPAIVSAAAVPPWLDISVPVESIEQFRGYYRLQPADLGFEPDGKAYHRNHNPNPAQLAETFAVSEATRARILAMLKEEEGR
jgi:hypothetical protein